MNLNGLKFCLSGERKARGCGNGYENTGKASGRYKEWSQGGKTEKGVHTVVYENWTLVIRVDVHLGHLGPTSDLFFFLLTLIFSYPIFLGGGGGGWRCSNFDSHPLLILVTCTFGTHVVGQIFISQSKFNERSSELHRARVMIWSLYFSY